MVCVQGEPAVAYCLLCLIHGNSMQLGFKFWLLWCCAVPAFQLTNAYEATTCLQLIHVLNVFLFAAAAVAVQQGSCGSTHPGTASCAGVQYMLLL